MLRDRVRGAWTRLTATRVPTETLWLVLAAVLLIAFVVVVVAGSTHHR